MITIDLHEYQLVPIFLSLVVVLAATEVGRLLGVRAGDRGGDQVFTLESAVLGLLALMIAFTFAILAARLGGINRFTSVADALERL